MIFPPLLAPSTRPRSAGRFVDLALGLGTLPWSCGQRRTVPLFIGDISAPGHGWPRPQGAEADVEPKDRRSKRAMGLGFQGCNDLDAHSVVHLRLGLPSLALRRPRRRRTGSENAFSISAPRDAGPPGSHRTPDRRISESPRRQNRKEHGIAERGVTLIGDEVGAAFVSVGKLAGGAPTRPFDLPPAQAWLWTTPPGPAT